MDKSQNIKIYCRLKPLKKNEKSIEYEITNNDRSGVDVLDLKHQSYRNNHDTYKFRYNGVFNENTSQSLIFETVAVPILDKFLSGMNCTIFTYGQTSSGKTYTMYGNKKDRGIIPRSFDYIFRSAEDLKYNFKLEYIEIYKEDIYDLLDKNKIPYDNKVKYGVGKGGRIFFKSKINSIKISKKEEALKLLEIGNSKKNIACTSSNITSSRSHCICTIKFKKQKQGPEIKFNLVDLAGSENISNTTDDKKTLIESRSINSSLHHLNCVIRSLGNPNVHVPFRNSTITSVLKDSLGTDCATAMISTIVLNHRCIAESISTCRHSKEVSAIKYRVQEKKKINEKKQYKVIKFKDVLLEEKEHDMSGDFCSKAKENKIILMNKTTNTENNEDLINESVCIPHVLYDKLKDGICTNVECDVYDDRSKPDDFAIGDGIICVPVVDVTAPPVTESGDGINDINDNSKMSKVSDMLPLFVECGIGTEDILVTQSEYDDKNIYTPLKNSLINRDSSFYWRHYKMIQLILIMIILMFNSQFLISTVGFDIHSFVPEWLKSWDPAKLCPDGINNLQTFCCCGKCLRVCVKTIKDKINEKVIDSFCDCQLASRVTDSRNTASDHRLFKDLTWSDQMFDEYLTFIKSTVKISICVFIMLFITILIAMVLYKLFRLQQSSNNMNFDKSDTQNNKQKSPIRVNIGPEKLPTCTDEKCQPIHFNTKVQQYLNNQQPSPITVNIGPENFPTRTDEKCQPINFNTKVQQSLNNQQPSPITVNIGPEKFPTRTDEKCQPINFNTKVQQSLNNQQPSPIKINIEPEKFPTRTDEKCQPINFNTKVQPSLNNQQPSPITVNIEPEKFPTRTDEKCQHIYFNTKVQQSLNNQQPSPITVNIGPEKFPTRTDEKCQPINFNTKVQQSLNNQQPSPITVNIEPEKFPTRTDEKCQHIYFNKKVQQYLNNQQPSPIKINIEPEKFPTRTDEKCQHIYFNKKFGSRNKEHYGRQYRPQTLQRPVGTLLTAIKGQDDTTQSTRPLTPQRLGGTKRQVEYTSSSPTTESGQTSSPSPGPLSETVTVQQTPTTQLQERSTINLCQGRISRNTSQCLADHQSSEDNRSGTNALDETTKATKIPKTENPLSGFKRYGFRRWI